MLEKLVYETDILLLQETKCREKDRKIKIPGYKVLQKDANHGLAIIISEKIVPTELNLEQYTSDVIQVQGINFQSNNQKINIINVYACNNNLTSVSQWDVLKNIKDSLDGEVLFCGDFNARGNSCEILPPTFKEKNWRNG